MEDKRKMKRNAVLSVFHFGSQFSGAVIKTRSKESFSLLICTVDVYDVIPQLSWFGQEFLSKTKPRNNYCPSKSVKIEKIFDYSDLT